MNKSQLIVSLLAVLAFLKSRVLFHVGYLFVSFSLAFLIVNKVAISEISPIVSTLQNISAAVFTLAGIWVAYSYPQAIAAYTSPSHVKIIPTSETKRIEDLVIIILTSAAVLCILLFHNLAYILVVKTIHNADVRFYLKSAGISSVFYASILQLKAIFTVMITNVFFVNELHHKKTELEANKDL
ncbi:MAG: hypothetical protein ACRC61_20760 [Aeromonas salmonicida]